MGIILLGKMRARYLTFIRRESLIILTLKFLKKIRIYLLEADTFPASSYHIMDSTVIYYTSNKENILFEELPSDSEFYFVHSYYLKCCEEFITSTFNYAGDFTSSIQVENIYGTQFHPEKSQRAGFVLLKNFLQI